MNFEIFGKIINFDIMHFLIQELQDLVNSKREAINLLHSQMHLQLEYEYDIAIHMKKQEIDLWAKNLQEKMKKSIQEIGELQTHLKDLKQKFDNFNEKVIQETKNKSIK
jgi:signal transduction histidine kinase